MTSHSKEDLERTRLSNKLDDYGNSFSRKSFFKLTFDSYIDIVKINFWTLIDKCCNNKKSTAG